MINFVGFFLNPFHCNFMECVLVLIGKIIEDNEFCHCNILFYKFPLSSCGMLYDLREYVQIYYRGGKTTF